MTQAHPRAMLETPRLRLVASASSLAAAVLDFQHRNRARFAPWDPPLGEDFLTLSAQRRRLLLDAKAFAAASAWRYWLQERSRSGRVIGQVHISQVTGGPFCSAMLGYQIDGEFEGRGLMREALAAALDEMFSPRVNLHRVQANVRPENARSLALLAALGFEREGLAREYLYIDGAWRDHVLTARLSPDFIKPEGW
jgi:ribosomal-protein-alanine N-acetyltransferase